jgi:putative transposase
VIAWEVSLTLEADFCVAALHRALAGRKPEIFNSDQGSQFTSVGFTEVLQSAGVRISMDGRGRVFDNIMVERLWRSVKYEEVYLKDYATPREARSNLREHFVFYNEERPHQSLCYATPAEVYRGGRSGFKSSRGGRLPRRPSHRTGLVGHTSGSLGKYLTGQTKKVDQRPAWVQ